MAFSSFHYLIVFVWILFRQWSVRRCSRPQYASNELHCNTWHPVTSKDKSINTCFEWPHLEAQQKASHYCLLLAASHCLPDLSTRIQCLDGVNCTNCEDNSTHIQTVSLQRHSGCCTHTTDRSSAWAKSSNNSNFHTSAHPANQSV